MATSSSSTASGVATVTCPSVMWAHLWVDTLPLLEDSCDRTQPSEGSWRLRASANSSSRGETGMASNLDQCRSDTCQGDWSQPVQGAIDGRSYADTSLGAVLTNCAGTTNSADTVCCCCCCHEQASRWTTPNERSDRIRPPRWPMAPARRHACLDQRRSDRRRQRTSETAPNTAAEDHDAAHGWHQMSVNRSCSLVRSLPSAGAVA